MLLYLYRFLVFLIPKSNAFVRAVVALDPIGQLSVSMLSIINHGNKRFSKVTSF